MNELKKTVEKHIVAMGGGGFSMEPDNPLLDRYVLGLTQKARPRVCFVGTASGDSQVYIDRFYGAFRKLPCEPFHFSVFNGTATDPRAFLLSMDAIYVGGGNTRNLITLWRDWGTDQILKDAWDNGIVLAGISAGSICWFEEGITDSIPGKMTPLTCLGYLKGSNCPHYDGEAERRPTFHRLLSEESILPGLAADDGVALHFIGDRLHRVVTSRPDAKAYRLEFDRGVSKETLIVPDYLGGNELVIRRAALKDTQGIHDAHMRSIRESCTSDYTPEQIEAWGGRAYDQKMRTNSIAQDCVWVIEDMGVILGFGHLMKRTGKPKTAEVMGLYLTPDVTGKQLGKRVLQLMEESATESGIQTLELGSTLTSIEFYRSQGFVESGPRSAMKIGGVDIPYLPMSKRLSAKNT